MPTCSSSVGIACIAQQFIWIINYVLVPLIFAAAFLVFLYGIAEAYIFSRGDSGKIEEGHRLVLWGIVGFAVMISLWGLVNVIANTFGLQGQSVTLPLSPVSSSGVGAGCGGGCATGSCVRTGSDANGNPMYACQ
ncbi:MAG: hypothetical protein WAN50_00765 [Minisyncoccia bacterium]